jgi:hypothetical protein
MLTEQTLLRLVARCAIIVALAVWTTGCRDDDPGRSEPQAAPSGAPSPDAGTPASRDTLASSSSTAEPAPSSGRGPTPGGAVPQSEQSAATNALNGFFATIDAGNEAQFRSSLAGRSVELLRSLRAEDEIWPIAREALGALEARRMTVLGGRADSVALLVTGQRREADSTVTEQFVLSLLRENEAWKVMYPGAQPWNEHVGP